MKYTFVLPVSVAAIILGGIGIGLLFADRGLAFQITIASSIMASLLNLLAIPYFLNGTKQFKAELKRAYIFLCFGIGAFGLAQVQLPLISIFELAFWINSGGLAVPYLLGVIGIFLGMRAFAKLLHIKTFWASPGIALAATIAISLAASRLPHVDVAENELSFQLALALSIWNSVFITFAAIVAYFIRVKIGEAYRRSMSWLSAALTVIAFAGWHYSIIQLTMTTGDWYYDYSLTIVPFLAGAFVLLIAGHAFDITDTFDEKGEQSDLHAPAELNVVLYVAGLASRPEDIDVTLDTVRKITSRWQPGDALSESDKQALAGVYYKIEDYLIHDDPLRTFTQDELRTGALKRFKLSPDVQALLWQKQK
jgi:hypothetical protein